MPVAALLALAAPADAQDPLRPWLDWRTIETANFRFHFTPDLEQWTREVARRVEAVDSALARIIGHSPPRPVHVVVDDPFGVSNGYALPLIDQPATVWWAFPPEPRNDVGNFRSWGELLAVHELAHLAHLTRPSRNPLQNSLWSSMPAHVGPLMRKAPRWVFEGYATLVEGRVTGSGRPNNAWRPAILRQWAIEGRLPTYAQLSGWDAFGGGEFAYLGGSAFFDWLTAREGDSSLVHLWRRMSARRVRTFEASFAGLFGDTPSMLYGRHAAELTRDALAAEAALRGAGLVRGEMIQRLTWSTGDPAVSPNGERVAITLRSEDRPSRVVVWKTSPEPEDTAALRELVEELKKDPHDVPDRRVHPRSKTADATLEALNGRSFQQPRWFPDNRRLLVTRWTPRADGSTSPDLYVWDTESGDVERITGGHGVLHGDPAPDGSDAVAMQCHAGHCDVARVDLSRGAMTTLLEGNAHITYYRPRYSPDGRRIAASVAEDGRWRVVVADRQGREMRYVDPEDGANRYDAEWVGNDALLVVSERGGVANLERLDLASGTTRTLTRVTGAAVAPSFNAADSSIWFLDLHARGYDLRRLPHGTSADSVVPVSFLQFGYAGVRDASAGVALGTNAVSPTRAYGLGPRHSRWLPGAYASGEGLGGFLTVFTGDIVGRLSATVTGAYGQPGTWQGGSLRAAVRVLRPTFELGVHGAIHEPSRSRDGQPAADSLDATTLQALLAMSGQRLGDGWLVRGRLGAATGRLRVTGTPSIERRLGFGELELQLQQQRGARGLLERLRLHATEGTTRGRYRRAVGALELATVGADMMPLELGVTVGHLDGKPAPYEQFTIGGIASPVGDSSLVSQRYGMPMLPTGIATGNTLLAWRAALPGDVWTLFYEGASADVSTALDLRNFSRWNRAVGLEMRVNLPPVAVIYVPRIAARAGVGYTLDAPFRRKVRGYVEMRMEP